MTNENTKRDEQSIGYRVDGDHSAERASAETRLHIAVALLRGLVDDCLDVDHRTNLRADIASLESLALAE